MFETQDFPVNESNWQTRREIIREIPYPEFWTLALAKKWANEIPRELEEEGSETPLIELDLRDAGYGKVLIKNEADRSINPTGTMKDRMARSCAAQYHYEAKKSLEFLADDPRYEKRFVEKRIRRYSMLTAGNAGMALAKAMESLNLPPPKLLLDKRVGKKTLENLKSRGADIYLVDLSKNTFTGLPSEADPLDPAEILLLTNNSFGIDLTSTNSGLDEDPHIVYYQNLAGQLFQAGPDEIYVPYGSGALFGEILVKQRLMSPFEIPGHLATEEDKKLARHSTTVKLFGAEPENPHSIADKLSAPVKPFPTSWETELNQYKRNKLTHPETGVVKITEQEIVAAYELLKTQGKPFGIETEPSASAGLALYMQRWKAGKIKPDAKIIIVNTGKGIISDQEA